MSESHVPGSQYSETFLTVEEVQRLLGIGRTAVYRLCHSDGLETVRVGRAIRIPESSFRAWVARGGSPSLTDRTV